MKLYEIAGVISADWKKVGFGAVPYLKAMSKMNSLDSSYGQYSGSSIVMYFLSNAGSWRGEVARAVKVELNKRLR